MKIVVFDMDETLGYFTQFSIFWDCLNQYMFFIKKPKLTQSDFNYILDLYPEFLRPNILDILAFLKQKKNTKCCRKMMIYTNNSGKREWAEYITGYFEHKLNYKLFDQIIAAFKVDGKIIEMCRTSKEKKHTDFIRCTKVPITTEICYLDDHYYKNMDNRFVYYVELKPYWHDLDFNIMINKLLNSNFRENIINENEFLVLIKKYLNVYKYAWIEKDPEELEIETITSKGILIQLEDFFYRVKKNITRKNLHKIRTKTSKRIK
jgi:hypothetical protein